MPTEHEKQKIHSAVEALRKKLQELEKMDVTIDMHLSCITDGVHRLEEDIKHKEKLEKDFERLEEYIVEHAGTAATMMLLQTELGYLGSAILNS